MSIVQAILLGAAQGLTEFLPVSSSGHLSVLQHFFHISENALLFDVVLHLGTLTAVLVVYRKTLAALLGEAVQVSIDLVKGRLRREEKNETRRLLFHLFLACLPLLLLLLPVGHGRRLMDLGAAVCTPKQPKCGDCPVARHCRALAEDAAAEFPRKLPPIAKAEQDWTIVTATAGGRLLVRQRPKGLLGGLYEFCAVEGHPDEAGLARALAEQGFRGIKLLRRLPDSKHVFTHRVWRMRGWQAECKAAPEGFIAVDAAGLDALPFPSALRVYREIAEEILK